MQRFGTALVAALALGGCCKSGASLSADDSTPQLSPNPLDFGTVVNGSTNTKSLNLHNSGGFTLQATQVTLSPAQAGDLSFSADPIVGQEVEPGADLMWPVHFNPTVDGVHQAMLTLQTNSNGTPSVQVQLTGIAYSFNVTIAPATLDFGEVQVGTISKPQSFTVTNDSTIVESLTLGPPSVDGGYAVTPGESAASLAAGDSDLSGGLCANGARRPPGHLSNSPVSDLCTGHHCVYGR